MAFTQIQALPAFYSGNDLVALMHEYNKVEVNASGVNWDKFYEYGAYILGVYDATEFTYKKPDQLTKRQIIAIVSKYLSDHPEEWSEPAAILVIRALKKALPLKESR